MEKSDEKIIEKYLSGDEAAFSEIVKIYLKPLYNFVFRLTNDRDAAEDLTQISFVKAWRNMKRFDPERNFRTWLYAIAKNTTFDWFKKKKELPFSKFEDEKGGNALENISDDNILPDEILEKKNIAKELEKILEQLPTQYRAILLLHYKEGFSLHEIAEILGESYNTIKSRHARALIRLRMALLGQKASITQ
jgi:RNA polymerase sigma-70 factor, ECF subfamily